MSTNTTVFKFFGIFFIFSFVFYATGNGLIESQINHLKDFSAIAQHKTQLIIGALLITFLHTLANIGLVVILFSIFKDTFSIQSYAYLSLAIISTIFLAIGGILLLFILPLSEWSTGVDNRLLAKFLQKGHFYFYQFGMILWCVGGLILCNMLLKTKAVTTWLSIWGLVGYTVFLVGCMFEIFGIAIGTITSIIGGLFEITLALVAIFKGFNWSPCHGSTRP